MKCEACEKQFPLTQLRFIPDGMVPGTSIKRHRAFCKEHGLPDLNQKGQSVTESVSDRSVSDPQPEKEYPF